MHTSEKVRRSDAVRLFLYVCAGFLAGILFMQGTEYVINAEPSRQLLHPVPTEIIARQAPIQSGSLIDINAATARELQALPGIGPALAEAIIRYRTEMGGFSFVEELMDINGIGRKKLDAIRPYVTCGPWPP